MNSPKQIFPLHEMHVGLCAVIILQQIWACDITKDSQKFTKSFKSMTWKMKWLGPKVQGFPQIFQVVKKHIFVL